MTDRKLRVYDDVLSSEVFSRLKRTVASMNQPPHSYWVDARKPPENLIELVIACLHRTVLPGRSFVGAEWWFRRESTAVSKKLHFDKDEALALKGQYVHPNLASVFYSTDVGGQTLITDQTCSPERTPSVSVGAAAALDRGSSRESLHGLRRFAAPRGVAGANRRSQRADDAPRELVGSPSVQR